MQDSDIEWLKMDGYKPKTWNASRGCKEVSDECAQCYAKQFAERWRGVVGHPYEFGFDFRLAPFKLEEPLTVPSQCTVFVNSMTDLFYGGDEHDPPPEQCMPDEYIRDMCDVMLKADWHIYIILTKRAERMRNLLNSNDSVFKQASESPHIWWGVSAGRKEKGLPRIQELQQTRASVRCVSFEPLLEDLEELNLHNIDWGKIGGESGNKGPRLMEKKWARSILAQLWKQGRIPRHFKQWGGVDKKKAGRKINGREYNEYPDIANELVGRKPPSRSERLKMIDDLREYVRDQWMDHPLLANVPDKMRPIYLNHPESSAKKRQLPMFDDKESDSEQ